MEAINANHLVSIVLSDMNEKVGSALEGDCMFIWCGIQSPLDDELRVVIEDMVSQDNDSEDGLKHRLIVILETNGGYIEVVERMVSVMRKHYREVYFVVPGHAYSAGTVLVLSGDKIFMDYYSVLGPIDPQYQDEDGQLLPGAGYLAKFEELTKRINSSRSQLPNATKAELAFLIKRFDPAKLFHIEQAIEHGQSLVMEWLPKYKFKNWKTTRTRKRRVTAAMRRDRAKQVARMLGKADRWHSHGRGISMRELEASDIDLLIDDFGQDPEVNEHIRNYHGLAVDFARKMGYRGFIHTKGQSGMRQVL
ncbi:MAG: hypothetical protein DHS20C01_01930 [marine bacterium B5-7]|nr:MAG: hypothetical protein DHS20C01_01930 [marine bacterium B5-7]